MNELPDDELQYDLQRQAMAAALTNFATLLKVRGFPKVIKLDRDGQVISGVMMPVLQWRVFPGGMTEIVHRLRTDGLPTEESISSHDHCPVVARTSQPPTLRLV